MVNKEEKRDIEIELNKMRKQLIKEGNALDMLLTRRQGILSKYSDLDNQIENIKIDCVTLRQFLKALIKKLTVR